MKPYLVKVHFPGYVYRYTGLFRSSCAAITDALERFFDEGARGYSARPAP